MKTISENTLNALQEGNHKAFEEIFIIYFNKIKIFISAYIKSDSDAEDLTEELFINLWTNRESIDISKSFNSYLHTMARNAALNFLRHKLVQDTYHNNFSQPDAGFSSEDDLIARETALLIEMTVERMPEQRKKIYRLSRNEGLKNEEIAERLNTTKRNVESQLSLALKDIHKVISAFLILLS
jgi:RNA polymerase sigma-70 factor (ECF subfamily)